MKYIYDILDSEDSTNSEILFAITVYSVFKENGFVDSYFDEEGKTMLNILIDSHSSEVFAKLFLLEAGPTAYLPRFDGTSPLKYAADQNKMSHVKLMLEYFAKNPSKIHLNHDDFLQLLTLQIPEAKIIINT